MSISAAWTSPHSPAPYVAPFAGFIGTMAVEKLFDVPPQIGYPLRCLVSLTLLLLLSKRVTSLRPTRRVASVLLGLAVFVIWVAPDFLFDYRGHWLFQNAVTGKVAATPPESLQSDWVFLAVRVLGSTLLVPVIEELFWRAWLMRWVANQDFWKLPLGHYSTVSFTAVAVLFASEHGPYWEVGLAAGVLYGWWLVRTRNLGDCIVAHATTNAVLAAYVLTRGQWRFWL
jgi:CAAX prenyl protease-like protein